MNVKTIRCLHFAFAFVLLATSAKDLTCFQGQRLVENEKEVSDNFISRSCSDPNANCHRYYFSASSLAQPLSISISFIMLTHYLGTIQCKKKLIV